MNKPLRLDAQAEAELWQAVSWYEQKRAGLGLEMLEEVNRVLQTIGSDPSRAPIAPDVPPHLGVRRQRTRRFPYTVFYLEMLHEIRVLAVAHASRRPGYWKGRMEQA